jgi:DNA-directed RNA polymerase subunit RPC12/RpoP
MTTIKCPKCRKETSFELRDAIDEEGEIYRCQHCGWPFHYK